MMWMDLQGQLFMDMVVEMVKAGVNLYLKEHTMTPAIQ